MCRVHQVTNRTTRATKEVTATAIARGIRDPSVVHFMLRVSFHMVYMVVAQGLCNSEKSMRFTAVSKVQPLSCTNKLYH